MTTPAIIAAECEVVTEPHQILRDAKSLTRNRRRTVDYLIQKFADQVKNNIRASTLTMAKAHNALKDQKAAIEALQADNERLRAAVRESYDAIWTFTCRPEDDDTWDDLVKIEEKLGEFISQAKAITPTDKAAV